MPMSAVLGRGSSSGRKASRELVEQARALDLTIRELFAEALRLAVPGSFDAARPLPPRWH
jgi:hypothetical protein